MKKKIKKLIKRGVITKKELKNFITTLTKLSKHNIVPDKPKKVIKNLTKNTYYNNIPQKEVEIQDIIN